MCPKHIKNSQKAIIKPKQENGQNTWTEPSAKTYAYGRELPLLSLDTNEKHSKVSGLPFGTAKMKRPASLMLVRMCSNSSFEPLLVGAQRVTMGHGFAMSQRDTHASQMIHLSQSHVFIQEKWKHMSTQSLTNVQGSFLCNSPRLETIQHSPVDERKNKLVDHGTEGILISNEAMSPRAWTSESVNQLEEALILIAVMALQVCTHHHIKFDTCTPYQIQ